MKRPVPSRAALLAALLVAFTVVMASCDDDPASDATKDTMAADTTSDTAVETTAPLVLPPPDGCGADGVCAILAGCHDDPDCPECDCDLYKGACEAAGNDSTEPCECDPDCADGALPCASDGHCDTWCPQRPDGSSWDADCIECTCGYYPHMCDVGMKCSLLPCDCDADCSQGRFFPCEADGHCDTWCPTGSIVDSDCQQWSAPKYCDGNGCDSTTPDGMCFPECGELDIDCSPCACDLRQGICDTYGPSIDEECGCDPDCIEGTADPEGYCDYFDPTASACEERCLCDYIPLVCDAGAACTDQPCACDPECERGVEPCIADGVCDPWCPTDSDPDCPATSPLDGRYCTK